MRVQIYLTQPSQLAVFIRGVDEEIVVTEKLLALRPLQGTTTGKDIFAEVQSTFEQYGLQWCKLVEVCTDGASSVVGSRKGLIGILKERATAINVQECDSIIL